MKRKILALSLIVLLAGCGQKAEQQTSDAADKAYPAPPIFDGESHFANLKQITFGGENAEAYFSHDGSELIFQSTRDSLQCDAIFRMNADGSNVR